MIESLKQLAIEQFPENSSDADLLEISDLIANEMESVDLESFLMWAVKRNALEHLLDMLHQVKGKLQCNPALIFICSINYCSCVM